MKLVVGLGNPGKDYNKTRHNIGFMILDAYLSGVNWQEKFQALYYKTNISGEIVYFIKPQTFMNLSGHAVAEYVNYFNIAIEDILIIQDDLDINFGQYKLKKNSSSGGHNGIKSIISNLGTEAFLRLKVGIRNTNKHDTIDFVLGKFYPEEQKTLEEMYPIYTKIIDSFIKNGIEKTMNTYNTK
ncbi:MAG: aminoacyl-tRNA hydrolase [Bacilli bacterium]|nr:aminoacyl-tRNA hydrolase [Bacilli bacterium]